MGVVFLIVMVAAWALVLGPVLLRDGRGPVATTLYRGLEKARSVVDGRTVPLPGRGRLILAPPKQPYPVNRQATTGEPGRRTAAQRRRAVMTKLAAFIVTTFVFGLLPHMRGLLYLCLVGCVLLVAYVAAAVWFAARVTPPTSRTRSEVPTASAAGSAG